VGVIESSSISSHQVTLDQEDRAEDIGASQWPKGIVFKPNHKTYDLFLRDGIFSQWQALSSAQLFLVEDKEGHWVKIKEPVAKEHP
jgi:hypothetical protein